MRFTRELVMCIYLLILFSDAPIPGYNLTFFTRYLLLLLVFCIICYYLRRLSLDFQL